MTPEQMAECAAGGRYWFMRPDGTFYGSDERDQPDTYLPEWVAQWPDWDAAVAEMAPLFERLDEFRD